MSAQAAEALARARERMQRTGQWSERQHMGRRWAIGCVALEITQRCNLDCALCYLSESSQAMADPPLGELFGRIDRVREWYGAGTDVQITGGEPTLRPRAELLAVVRRAAQAGLRPALFTNGIRASRDLLAELSAAGLVDVAFHVDTTQQRRGYADEAALNALRAVYVERARGLPLAVIFNTSVCDANLDQLPEVVRFLVRASDVVRFASFQIHADTGRGVLRGRPARLGVRAVIERIRAGTDAPLEFDATDVGHARCNRYAMALVCGGRVHDLLDDPALARRVLAATAGAQFDRRSPRRALAALLRGVLARPGLLPAGLAWLARKAWRMGADLLRSRGRVHKLSFFVHNFMHACELERERIEACVFMVATRAGPVSMCEHNARRDAYLLPPGAAPVHLTRMTARGTAKLRCAATR